MATRVTAIVPEAHMVSPVRLLTMQLPKTQAFAPTGVGGIAHMTPALAAAHAARMPDRWWMAARWKWMHDTSVALELFDALLVEVRAVSAAEKWHGVREQLLSDFSELALAELMYPGHFGGEHGEARRRVWLSMTKAAWSRRRRLYDATFRIVNDWAAMAFGFLQAAQRED